jgi:hypothetical protein
VAERPDDLDRDSATDGDTDRTTDPAPDAPTGAGESRGIRRYWWVAGLAIVAFVVIVLVPLASGDPDGLQRVAQDNGFLGSAQGSGYSVIPGYTIPGRPRRRGRDLRADRRGRPRPGPSPTLAATP